MGRYADVVRKFRNISRIMFSDKYLLTTNIGISFGLSSVGDVIEQQYEIYNGDIEKWDRTRTWNMSVAGVSVGVICHYWYNWIDRRLPSKTIQTVMYKVALDQFVCSPFYLSIFFITMAILEKQSKEEMWEDMKKKGWKLYVAEWFVWPPAQFINFYWLPTKYRVLYDNLISLAFDVYTSQVKYND